MTQDGPPPHGEGYLVDRPDSRDKVFLDTLYKEIATTGVHTQAGFLQVKPIPSYDQQNLGSCVANAVALAIRYGLQIHIKTQDKNKDFTPSRLFIWYWAKYLGAEDDKAHGWRKDGGGPSAVQLDEGSCIRDAIKSLFQKGCPPEKLWPYPASTVAYAASGTKKLPDGLATIPNEASQAAKDYFNIKFQYFRIKTVLENTSSKQNLDNTPDLPSGETSRVTQIKACIAEGYPVVFGIRKRQKKVGNSWEDVWRPYSKSNCIVQGGTLVLKEPPTKLEGEWSGGHAMVIVGFNRDINRDPKVPITDKLPGAFEVQNSWGEELSRFYIPYSYFESSWVYDIWTIKIEGLLNDPQGTGKQF